ncbi:MAG: glycosyltransferase family 4 protein [Clostridiales bacterium]|nr:glycosyltransferase family 4 protein [Clostridiales bacterium]
MKVSFKNEKVLFITTKNLDYLRNSQEIELIKSEAKSVDVIGSQKKSYLKRLLYVNMKILLTKFRKYDTVFVGFSPQLIVPIWAWKFRKVRLIEDFFISVYDTMVFDRKRFKKNSFMARICKYLDKKTISKAEHIICDTNAHGDYFSSEFNVERQKIETLYLKADIGIYHPMNIDKDDKLKDKFVVLYFGSILPLQGLDIILGALDKLKEEKDLYFYIVGPINNKFNKSESDNIEYIEWLSQEKLAEMIAMSDLCLAGHFNKEIDKAKRTIPGKAYIYEAMNKPMILGDNEATRELYSDSMHNVFFVEMGNALALAEKIIQCKKELHERK